MIFRCRGCNSAHVAARPPACALCRSRGVESPQLAVQWTPENEATLDALASYSARSDDRIVYRGAHANGGTWEVVLNGCPYGTGAYRAAQHANGACSEPCGFCDDDFAGAR